MGIRLSTNVSSLSVNRRLSEVNEGRVRTFEKLSSGDRIVRSADDAAGLAVSEKLKAGIRSMQVAVRNSNDGISVLQTAEGGINEVQSILIRLRELAVQAASDTIGNAERSYVNQEFQSLKDEITRVANTTKFNGAFLLNGLGKKMEFQVGIDGHAVHDRLGFDGANTNITAAALGISGSHVANKESAGANLRLIDKAVEQVGMHRSYLGAVHTALQSNVYNVSTQRENTAQGNSRIRDADMAQWTAEQVKQDIIAQSGISVQAQANNMPEQALKLLGAG